MQLKAAVRFLSHLVSELPPPCPKPPEKQLFQFICSWEPNTYLLLFYMLPKFFSPLCPSWAPPDFVNPLLKNMPTLEPQGSLCTHPWGVLCYSPHGEESPRTYRIKRCLFRLEKRILSALQTSSAGHIWKSTQLLAENLFSAERINSLYPSQKGTSNSWFSGWGDGETPSPARL